MSGNGKKNANSVLLSMLATGTPIKNAATASGLSERTIHRRLEDKGFRTELERMKDAAVSAAVAKLSDSCVTAVETLRSLLTGSSESVRLGAARSILEMSVSMRQATELSQRVTELEEKRYATQKTH